MISSEREIPMSKSLLTRSKGRIGSAHVLTQGAYKTKPQETANGFAQKLMRKGSFSTPGTAPKRGASNFPGQGKADSMPGFGAGLKQGKCNF
jgi:hypothetical protein